MAAHDYPSSKKLNQNLAKSAAFFRFQNCKNRTAHVTATVENKGGITDSQDLHQIHHPTKQPSEMKKEHINNEVIF